MARCSLYRFYDEDDQLLYVGITHRLGIRLSEHGSDKHWWWQVARVTVEHFETRNAAASYEQRAIVTEKPLWNIAGRRAIDVGEDQARIEDRAAAAALSKFLRPFKIV